MVAIIQKLSLLNAQAIERYLHSRAWQRIYLLIMLGIREILISFLSIPLYLKPVYKQSPEVFNSKGMAFSIYRRRRRATIGSILSVAGTMLVYLSFSSFFLFHSSLTRAVTITWDGGGADNNWSTAQNWSTDTVPATIDDVVFDGATASSTRDVIYDAGVGSNTILSVDIQSGYTGTITLGQDLIVTNDFSIADGTFSAGTGTVDIDGNFTQTGGVFNASSATTSVAQDFRPTAGTFSATTGTLVLDGTTGTTYINVTTSLSVNNLTINKTGTSPSVRFEDSDDDRITVSGTLHLIDGSITHDTSAFRVTLEAQGAVTQESTWSGGAGLLHITGNARTITFPADANINAVQLESTSTLLALSGTGTTSIYSATIDHGTIETNDADVTYTTFLLLRESNAAYHGGSGNEYFTGGTFRAENGTVYFGAGDVTVANSSVDFDVTGDAFVSATSVPNIIVGQNLDIASNGQLDTGSTSIIVGADFTLSSNGVFNGASSSLYVSTNFTMTSGTYNAPVATTSVVGDFTVTGGTFNTNAGAVSLVGSGISPVYITTSGTLELADFEVNKSGNILVQFNNLDDQVVVTGTFGLIGGSLNGGNGLVEVQNGFIHDAGFGSGSGRISITGNARTIDLAPDGTLPQVTLDSDGTVLNLRGGGTTTFRTVTISAGTIRANTSSLSTLVHLFMSGVSSTYDGGTGNTQVRFGMYSLSGATIKTGDGWVTVGGAGIFSSGNVDFSSSSAVDFTGTSAGSYIDMVSSNVTATPGIWTIAGGIHPTIGTVRLVNSTNFNANSGTIQLVGTGDQHINTSNVAVTFNNLEKTVNASTTIRFGTNASTTVINQLTLTGSSTNTISIVSGVCDSLCRVNTGTQAMVSVLGTTTIQDASVMDIDASGGITIFTGTNVEDLGNNINFNGLFDITLPTSPDPVTIAYVLDTSARIVFGAVTSSDANFTDYRLHYRTGTGATTTDTAIVSTTDANLASSVFNSATSTAFASLTTSTQYSVLIAAYDAYGNYGVAASEASFFTLPPAVTGASAVANGSSEVTVSWDTGQYLPGTTYLVTGVTDPSQSSGYTSNSSHTFTGLTAGTAYTYDIVARDNNAQDSAAVQVSATTEQAGSIPSTPSSPSTGGGETSSGGSSGGSGGGGSSALSINGGAATTQFSEVSIDLNVPDAAQVAISNDPSFSGVAYQQYTEMIDWTLLPGIGDRVVYARFRADDGGQLDADATITVVETAESGTEETTPETGTETGTETTPPEETQTETETGTETEESQTGGSTEESTGGET